MISGWDDFKHEHYEKRAAIEVKKSSREVALENLAKIKKSLNESIERDEKNAMINRLNRIMGGHL
jgi:hypothetical protein